MTIDQMRSYIAGVYKGPFWKDKVSKMDEGQVVAIYYSFLERGVFDKKPEPKPATPVHIEEPTFEQLAFEGY